MPLDNAKPRNLYAIDDPRVHTGQIVQAGDGWRLNPVSTAPITLLDASLDTANDVKRLLERSYNAPDDSVRELAALIGTRALTFKELRHSLEAYRLRCFPAFEKAKSESQEYRDAFAEQPVPAPSETMTRNDIRVVFCDGWYSLKQFALDSGFPYRAVTAHFGGKRLSAPIQEAAQKVALRLRLTHRREEVVSGLRRRAEELASIPPTAAEVMPIWEGELQPMVIARQVVERFHRAGAINLHQLQTIDSDGSYRTPCTTTGPIDKLTCTECRELMERVFKIGEIPEVPVHPGCRCTLDLDTSELERNVGART
jgi:hypothetical protein